MLSRSLNMMSTVQAPLHAESLSHAAERRRALRVELPFPVTVRGVDVNGERFTVHTVLDVASSNGGSVIGLGIS